MKAWNERDQSDGVDNSALETARDDAETAKNTAQFDHDTAEGEYNDEFAKIEPLQTAYDDKKKELELAYNDWELMETEAVLWGREAVEA